MKTYTVTALAGLIAGIVAAVVLSVVLIVSGSAERQGVTRTQAQVPPNESILPKLTPIDQLKVAVGEVHATYAPEVPPPAARTEQRIFEVHLEIVEEKAYDLDPTNGVRTEKWGYRIAGDTRVVCGVPGPVLRGRVGDVARIKVTNRATNTQPHNIDFHAVTGQGGGAAALTVMPGQSATIEVRLLYPGAFMYHCAAGDVPQHIAHGMYGMFIVDPERPLPPVDHEWAIMQSEWYVSEPGPDGIATFDRERLALEEPRYVTFNGVTNALMNENELVMRVGERARIYFVNEGLNLDSNFHPIGSHWDVVYPEGATHPANIVIRGSQTTLVPAGGSTVVELVGLVPMRVVLVDHALVRTFYRGALGMIRIEGAENPEIFREAEPAAALPPSDAAEEARAAALREGTTDSSSEATATLLLTYRFETNHQGFTFTCAPSPAFWRNPF